MFYSVTVVRFDVQEFPDCWLFRCVECGAGNCVFREEGELQAVCRMAEHAISHQRAPGVVYGQKN